MFVEGRWQIRHACELERREKWIEAAWGERNKRGRTNESHLSFGHLAYKNNISVILCMHKMEPEKGVEVGIYKNKLDRRMCAPAYKQFGESVTQMVKGWIEVYNESSATLNFTPYQTLIRPIDSEHSNQQCYCTLASWALLRPNQYALAFAFEKMHGKRNVKSKS